MWIVPVAILLLPFLLWALSHGHRAFRIAVWIYAILLGTYGFVSLVKARLITRAAEEAFARTGDEAELHMQVDHAALSCSLAGWVALVWGGIWLTALALTIRKKSYPANSAEPSPGSPVN